MRMAAAGWNQETKARLSEKVAVNMNDLASLTKHVLRGSKSSDVSSVCLIITAHMPHRNMVKLGLDRPV